MGDIRGGIPPRGHPRRPPAGDPPAGNPPRGTPRWIPWVVSGSFLGPVPSDLAPADSLVALRLCRGRAGARLACNAPHTPLQLADEWVDPYRQAGIHETHARLYGMVTNIDAALATGLPGTGELKTAAGGLVIDGFSGCYADVGEGELLALEGSGGRLELALRAGSAAALPAMSGVGMPLRVYRGE